jgi:hypothetical protein
MVCREERLATADWSDAQRFALPDRFKLEHAAWRAFCMHCAAFHSIIERYSDYEVEG